MPSSPAARNTRMAISERLATSRRLMRRRWLGSVIGPRSESGRQACPPPMNGSRVTSTRSWPGGARRTDYKPASLSSASVFTQPGLQDRTAEQRQVLENGERADVGQDAMDAGGRTALQLLAMDTQSA